MSDRYDLFLASMQEASRTVMIVFGLACGILGVRWSIRFAPGRFASALRDGFDLWLVAVYLFLFTQ